MDGLQTDISCPKLLAARAVIASRPDNPSQSTGDSANCQEMGSLERRL